MDAMQGRFVLPETVVTHFHLHEGDIVADFGAGKGYFTKVLSNAVGQEGHVYACEIQKNLIEALGDTIRTEQLENVDVLWSDIESEGGSKVDTEILDVGVLVNTLFQVEDKDSTLKEINRTLRSGGKLFIIDWSESFSGLGPQPEFVVTADGAQAIAETHGFVFERSFDAGDHHYGLSFRKK